MKFNCTEAVTTVIESTTPAPPNQGGEKVKKEEEVKPNVDGKKTDSRKD